MTTAATRSATVDGVDQRTAPPPTPVTIVVRGRLSPRLTSAFPELVVEQAPGRTVLRGPVGSRRLVEVLTQLRDLGIEPVTVDVDD